MIRIYSFKRELLEEKSVRLDTNSFGAFFDRPFFFDEDFEFDDG